MKIVVTGSAGYIGNKLVGELLRHGHQVSCFDNLFFRDMLLRKSQPHNDFKDHPRCQYFYEDVTDWSDNLKRCIDSAEVIYPLAALVGAPLCDLNVREAVAINQIWMEQLTTTLVNQIVVFPNTNSGYGAVPDGLCTEETPLNPLSLYARTKQAAEKSLIDNYHRGVVFRLATVFGVSPRPRTDLLVNNLVKSAVLDGEITVFDGGFRRNYVHIDDVVSAFMYPIARINDMKGQVYNLGNDSINMTKTQLAQVIQQVTGCKLFVDSSKTDPDKRDYEVSSAKLYKVGFRPKFDLEYGIRELKSFYENEYELMDPDSCRNY